MRHPTSSTSTEKLKNRIMLKAKEPVISTRFFFADTAWRIPRAVSMPKKRVFTAWDTFPVSSELPDAAVTGDTLDALLAGA